VRPVVGAAILVLVFGSADLLFLIRPAPVPVRVARFEPAVTRLPVDSVASVPARRAQTTGEPLSAFVDNPLAFLSRAPSDSLELLPGIGPVLASRILEARALRGAFRTWDDFDRVRGIGPATLRRLRELSGS